MPFKKKKKAHDFGTYSFVLFAFVVAGAAAFVVLGGDVRAQVTPFLTLWNEPFAETGGQPLSPIGTPAQDLEACLQQLAQLQEQNQALQNQINLLLGANPPPSNNPYNPYDTVNITDPPEMQYVSVPVEGMPSAPSPDPSLGGAVFRPGPDQETCPAIDAGTHSFLDGLSDEDLDALIMELEAEMNGGTEFPFGDTTPVPGGTPLGASLLAQLNANGGALQGTSKVCTENAPVNVNGRLNCPSLGPSQFSILQLRSSPTSLTDCGVGSSHPELYCAPTSRNPSDQNVRCECQTQARVLEVYAAAQCVRNARNRTPCASLTPQNGACTTTNGAGYCESASTTCQSVNYGGGRITCECR
jgi:hypothetical protein